MGIETIITYPCIPKNILTVTGILERLKTRDRAEAVIRLYREQGDQRPLEEIGFEVTQRAADGSSETQTIIAAEALVQAQELDSVAPHCVGCPANRINQPFGCISSINFPFSEVAEIWLLGRLPAVDDPLLHILRRGMVHYGYDGASIRTLRDQEGVYFASHDTLARPYLHDEGEDFILTSDQLFEMMFLVGPIHPGHAALLLLIFNIIPRHNLNPDKLFWLMNASDSIPDQDIPFQLSFSATDDPTIRDLTQFFHALYLAYRLGVPLAVDV